MADEDVRDEFFATMTHRPRAGVQEKLFAATLYHARVALGEPPGKVLIGEVAKRVGLTDRQVEHAARDYKASVEADIAAMPEKILRSLVESGGWPARPEK